MARKKGTKNKAKSEVMIEKFLAKFTQQLFKFKTLLEKQVKKEKMA